MPTVKTVTSATKRDIHISDGGEYLYDHSHKIDPSLLSEYPSELYESYPDLTSQGITDEVLAKLLPASPVVVAYAAAWNVATGSELSLDRIAALEKFVRGCVAAGDHLISKRLFLFGDTLAASAIDLWSGVAKLTWMGNPTVTASHVVGNGSTQYGILNDAGTSVWANDSGHLGFFSLDNVPAGKYPIYASSSPSAVMSISTGAVDQLYTSGMNSVRGAAGIYVVGGSKCGVVMFNDLAQTHRLAAVVDDTIQASVSVTAGAGTPPTVNPIIMGLNQSGVITPNVTMRFRCWFMGHGFPSSARQDAFMFRLQELLSFWYPFPS